MTRVSPTPGPGSGRFDFDRQAATFDQRAGLPRAATSEIARAVVELAGPPDGGLVVELGAGTGEIGARVAALTERYVGLDVSLPMLGVFRGRPGRGRPGRGRPHLVQADADRAWPLCERCAKALFLSRAAHLLAPEHLLAEAERAGRPEGAVLVLGRVLRRPDSVRATLRREMRRLLHERGVEGKSGGESRRRLIAMLEERGGEALPPRRAASWSVQERPADSLASWRAKRGLAGTPLDREIRRDVLDRLEAWARARWGDLEAGHETTETYELAAVRLPTRKRTEGDS